MNESDITSIVSEYASWAGGLMPALHAIQHHAGYIDSVHVPLLADTFNLSVAEVHGVITFYKDFRTTAPAGPVVHVCRAEACLSRGGAGVFRSRPATSSLPRADAGHGPRGDDSAESNS